MRSESDGEPSEAEEKNERVVVRTVLYYMKEEEEEPMKDDVKQRKWALSISFSIYSMYEPLAVSIASILRSDMVYYPNHHLLTTPFSIYYIPITIPSPSR